MYIETARKIYTLIRDGVYRVNGMFYFEMVMMYSTDLAVATKGKELPDKWICDMAIWFPTHKELVGIELKEWAKPVPPKVIQRHYEAYSRIFDKFYLAAPDFSEKTLEKYENSHVGLIVMDKEGYWIDTKPLTNRVFSSAHQDFRRRLENNWHKHYVKMIGMYGELIMPKEPAKTSEISNQQRLP